MIYYTTIKVEPVSKKWFTGSCFFSDNKEMSRKMEVSFTDKSKENVILKIKQFLSKESLNIICVDDELNESKTNEK